MIARFRLPVFIPCLLVTIYGCRRGEPERGPGESASGEKVIGVSLLTMQHQFYQDLRAGMETAAGNHGYKLLIRAAEFDSAKQANQIDEFIVQKVHAMVICPCDSQSVGTSIQAANQANIPVFTADIAKASAIGRVVAHIASDNVEGGRKAADLLAAALGGTGDIAILSHPEVQSVSARVRGFKERIAVQSGLRVVAELSAQGKRDVAVRVMEDILQAQPELAGVFCINDDTALGALAAIEAAGKAGKVQIVGYDATPEARAKIAARAIYGDVIQHPQRIGELTIQAIHDHFSGKTPPAVVPVGVGVFTARDARP